MRTIIIDYNTGNLHSVKKSFQLVAAEINAGEVIVSDRPEEIAKADRVVLPGVGSFDTCRNELLSKLGLFDAIYHRVIKESYPLLGICVGHQLLATTGSENNCTTPGLNWVPGDVVQISTSNTSLKIPHMGWNSLQFDYSHSLLDGISANSHMYFVHSYHLIPDDYRHRLSHVQYGSEITAAVVNGNIAGTQFHPEKSQGPGLTFIRNFLLWKP